MKRLLLTAVLLISAAPATNASPTWAWAVARDTCVLQSAGVEQGKALNAALDENRPTYGKQFQRAIDNDSFIAFLSIELNKACGWSITSKDQIPPDLDQQIEITRQDIETLQRCIDSNHFTAACDRIVDESEARARQ